MSYRKSTLLPYNQLPGLSYPSTQYDPVDHQRQPSHSLPTEQDGSYEMRRPRSYSSAQYLLADSANDDDQTSTRRPSSTFSSVKGFAVTGHGLWENQMLVDRSLRFMAVLTSVLAVMMCTLVFVYLKDFIARPNRSSTSVYAEEEDCKSANWKISAIHLFINIAATMILGMSNTYQQLVTSLDAVDIPAMLRKYGDSKVGTNSPFSINRKIRGKTKAWFSWILLISTSLPIHLLANSVVGLSYSIGPPELSFQANSTRFGNATDNFSCWSAFRTERYWWPYNYKLPTKGAVFPTPALQDSNYYSSSGYRSYSTTYEDYTYRYWAAKADLLTINYNEEACADLLGTASTLDQLTREFNGTIAKGPCINGVNIACKWTSTGRPRSCRISVRMQAALTLATALLIKAVYMLFWNVRQRNHIKTKCLTFGDVIAASALNPELQISNECLVNAGEAYRKQVDHSCHKHCKSNTISSTGDELGHCQDCTKYNKHNLAAGLEHPIVATKYKKSLISNLGFTAVLQMIMLAFCCFAMLGVSLTIAIIAGAGQDNFQKNCRRENTDRRNNQFNRAGYNNCMKEAKSNWDSISGGWGGFNESISLATLPSDEMLSETAAFMIANGAQLIYSLLYLLLIYNLTLISMEHDWGTFESTRQKLRCTIFKGRGFAQSYLLQLPRKVLFPLMGFSAMMHWLLGQAIATKEWVYDNPGNSTFGVQGNTSSQYEVVYAAYPVWLTTLLMLTMTSVCWYAFSYSRQGYMPQIHFLAKEYYGETVIGETKKYRHAGFTATEPGKAFPGELYCGGEKEAKKTD
ncbi:hypothetical protein FKW77_009136 [Venturia effusa]|uniref:DUF6536 domain-containing protein n=1 Tax=Venturia effusa TaxID=50376 RepID=A0A517LCY0_9PEZI|nr:hypothetical protein FKW77_009136 [Venturia effusa]